MSIRVLLILAAFLSVMLRESCCSEEKPTSPFPQPAALSQDVVDSLSGAEEGSEVEILDLPTSSNLPLAPAVAGDHSLTPNSIAEIPSATPRPANLPEDKLDTALMISAMASRLTEPPPARTSAPEEGSKEKASSARTRVSKTAERVKRAKEVLKSVAETDTKLKALKTPAVPKAEPVGNGTRKAVFTVPTPVPYKKF